ncbi:MAG TPA: DUF3303 family protein [Marmoricola sp.]|jgi:hypothetical protein|nr:DUF3303 family protein [Marmoricola sp.]
MKYVISWETRPGITEETLARSLQVFGKWSPAPENTFKEFLGRVDGNGGFAVVETDDPKALAKDTAPFGAFFEFHVYPCLDITDTAAIGMEAIGFLESIS